jgi:AcrR family transcriptional regulator
LWVLLPWVAKPVISLGEAEYMSDKGWITKIGRPTMIPGEKNTRDKIFEAAIDLFAESGYDRTSVRKIANAVGLTESAVYKHYPSKESILESIFAYAESHIYTPLPIERNLGEQAGYSIFRGLLAPLPRIIMSDPNVLKIVRIMYVEMHHNAKIRLYFQKEYVERANNYIEELFRRCIENGTIRVCDPRALALVFNAFRTEWAFQTYIINHEEPIDANSSEKDLQTVIDFFDRMFVQEKEI